MSQAERYIRQNMLPLYEGKQEVLASKKLAIIGLGGLGGLCSLLLATAGVLNLKIADRDVVALHNLHRQLLFQEQDINLAKATCAQNHLLEHNSKLNLTTFACNINEQNFATFIKDVDLLLDLSDDDISRLTISKLALQHKVNLLSGSVSAYTSLIAIFEYANAEFVANHGCYQCLTSGVKIDTKRGITGPIAASASSLVAHIAIEYLLGNKDFVGKLIHYNFQNLSLQKFVLRKDSSCQACHNLS